jgi:hypothetical protein
MNEACSATLLGTGGKVPYTWSPTVGKLRAGLSLVDNQVTGTPTVRGLYSFGLRLSDAQTPTASVTHAFSPLAHELDSDGDGIPTSRNMPSALGNNRTPQTLFAAGIA